jgi:hypothetical protein
VPPGTPFMSFVVVAEDGLRASARVRAALQVTQYAIAIEGVPSMVQAGGHYE